MNWHRGYLIIGILFVITAIGFARTSYTGYSGAPGSRGQCAASCHGNSGGTIQVTGFPTAYNPGQQYTITVSRSGGNSINQFNGSIRVGTGSQNAGTIAASTGTSTYNVSGETNGIRLSSANQTNATFLWTAPAAGIGEVKLYLTGMQGTSMSGANTNIILTAGEQTVGIDGEFQIAHDYYILNNFPNPFNAETRIRYEIPQSGHVTLYIFDIQGKKVANLFDGMSAAGKHDIIWNATSQPSGIYFCRLTTEYETISRLITLLK